MKILIKSVEEIEKTLDEKGCTDTICYNKGSMSEYSGRVLDSTVSEFKNRMASGWSWHQDWFHALSNNYDYEKFDSFEEACNWVANRDAILVSTGRISHTDWTASYIVSNWKTWYKVTSAKPKTLQIVRYLNVYINGEIRLHENKKEADKYAASHCIDCKRIELNYELRDGKWVEV